MRVAIVTESFLPSLNGVTTSVLRVVDSLRARGDDILIVAPTAPSEPLEGVSIVTVPHVVLSAFPIAIPTPAVAQALEEFGPDVIHAAAPFWLGGQAISWAAKRSVPSVAVYQTHLTGYMKRYGLDFAAPIIDALTLGIHRQATITLAPTQDGIDYLNGLGVRDVDLWARGVDSALFTPARRLLPQVHSFRKEVAQGAAHVVGYVGRLAPEKQVGRLIEVAELPDTRIVIVGDGPDRAELQDRFQGHPVTFLGKLTGAELANAYASMDVFVHCGTEETFGQTIQEAHASGIPVVAPSEGGQRHLIRNGVDGYLVDHHRWGAYREAVRQIFAHPELRESMTVQARDAVAGKTWVANNQKLLATYDRITQRVNVSTALAA